MSPVVAVTSVLGPPRQVAAAGVTCTVMMCSPRTRVVDVRLLADVRGASPEIRVWQSVSYSSSGAEADA